MRSSRRFLIVLLGLVLVAAACGNADEGDSDEASDSTSRPPMSTTGR